VIVAPENDKSGLFDRVRKSGKEFVDGVKEELDAGRESVTQRAKEYSAQQSASVTASVKRRVADTSTPEELYFSTWAWFWTMLFVIFICLSFFMFSLTNPRFILVGLLVLVALPFLVVWCLIHMVPSIRILGFTIFDRRKLSLRRQLSVGKEIARFFSREFLQEDPIIAFFIFAFFAIFILSLIFAFLG